MMDADFNFILIGLIELNNLAPIKKCDVRQWSGVLKVVNFIEVCFELDLQLYRLILQEFSFGLIILLAYR